MRRADRHLPRLPQSRRPPDALLMAIIGGPDAGKVDWHPSVLAEARKTGLSVDDDGNLIVEKPAT